MEYAKIGLSNLKSSLIGLGTGFRDGMTKDFERVIETSLDLGITLFDTAEMYEDGLSERVLGNTIKNRRNEVVLVSKVSGNNLRYEDVLKSAEKSLKRLKTNFLDLYLVHWPNPNIPIRETMKAMEKLVEDGKIRYIGVSNFNVNQIKEANEELSRSKIVVNEVKYNLLEREVEKEVLPFCQKSDIALLVYGVVAMGMLTGRFKDHNSVPKDNWRSKDWFFQDKSLERGVKMAQKLKEIGAGYRKTPGQVAINWLLSKDNVFPIFGATNTEQVKENIGAVGWRLDKKTIEKLS